MSNDTNIRYIKHFLSMDHSPCYTIDDIANHSLNELAEHCGYASAESIINAWDAWPLCVSEVAHMMSALVDGE